MLRLIRFLLLALMLALVVPLAFTQSPLRPARSRPVLFLDAGHSGPIHDLTLSPDGKLLATGGPDGTVRLWDVRRGDLRAVLQGHLDELLALAWSPDSSTLATGSRDFTARLWDARSGQVKAILKGERIFVESVAFSPDGATLATGNSWGLVTLWDAASGEQKRTLRGNEVVTRLAFSPDGKLLAAASRDATVRLWDLASGQPRGILRGHDGPVMKLAFSPNGELLASASNEVRLWDPHSAELKQVLRMQGHPVISLAFSPNGNTLVAGEIQGPVKRWDARTGWTEAVLQPEKVDTMAVAFSPDGKLLATGSNDSRIRLWDATTWKPLRVVDGRGGPVHALAFTGDSRELIAASEDAGIRCWDVADGQLTQSHPGNLAGVRSVAYSPDGTLLATGGEDQIVRLWDLTTGQLILPLKQPAGVEAIAFSSDGRLLAIGSWDRSVRLWDRSQGRYVAVLRGHPRPIRRLALSPDGKTLAVACQDWRIRLWDWESQQIRATLPPLRTEVFSLAFSPDGAKLAAGCGGQVGIWNGSEWVPESTGKRPFDGPVRALAFSSDGRWLASGHDDRHVRLWDTQTGDRTIEIDQGYLGEVRAVAFSRDGDRLATLSWPSDSRVQIWDVRSGGLLPVDANTDFADFPPSIRRPYTVIGASVLLHDPHDGRVIATLFPVPELFGQPGAGSEWCAMTPEGYLHGSANAVWHLKGNVNGVLYSGESFRERLYRPDLVQQALRGEKIVAPGVTEADVPPVVRFEGLKNGDLASRDPLPVIVVASDDRAVTGLQLLVNDRPLPAESVRPLAPRPIDVPSRSVTRAAGRGVTSGKKSGLSPRPIDVGSRSAAARSNPGPTGPEAALPGEPIGHPTGTRLPAPDDRVTRRFTCRVPLPLGVTEIRLRAIARDDRGLSSPSAEVVLRHAGARPVTGNLYVLAVGVSRYKNGRDPDATRGGQFPNLQFPAADARAVADRLRQEEKPRGAGGEEQPLYGQVQVIGPLINEQATIAGLRAAFARLQTAVRPGQRDTVVVYLSGHGISQGQEYYFATYETDLGNLRGTALSGRELQRALGKLPARSVFLLVDTCHSGGLHGINDHLAQRIGKETLFLASSGADDYSYESPDWGHGAFTLSLLRSLSKKEVENNGAIRFLPLATSVYLELERLFTEAGREEVHQVPCCPWVDRANAPLARARDWPSRRAARHRLPAVLASRS